MVRLLPYGKKVLSRPIGRQRRAAMHRNAAIFIARQQSDARYWYSNSVCVSRVSLSVCLQCRSVRQVPVFFGNGSTYCHSFFFTKLPTIALCTSLPLHLCYVICCLFWFLLFLCIISLAFHLLFGPRAASLLLNWLIDWLIDWLTRVTQSF